MCISSLRARASDHSLAGSWMAWCFNFFRRGAEVLLISSGSSPSCSSFSLSAFTFISDAASLLSVREPASAEACVHPARRCTTAQTFKSGNSRICSVASVQGSRPPPGLQDEASARRADFQNIAHPENAFGGRSQPLHWARSSLSKGDPRASSCERVAGRRRSVEGANYILTGQQSQWQLLIVRMPHQQGEDVRELLIDRHHHRVPPRGYNGPQLSLTQSTQSVREVLTGDK